MLRILPLIVAILPFAGITAAYWLNTSSGVLPSCIPYVEGCTSISATGRYPPGSLVFRAALLPQAGMLLVFWWLVCEWLRQSQPASVALRRGMFVAGSMGAVALIVYVTFLGSNLPFYEYMRRFGIYFYFGGTALAQLLLTLSLQNSRYRYPMLLVITTPFVLGVANLLLKTVVTDSNQIENTIEWIAALLMQAWFVLLYFVWRETGLVITVQTDSTNDRRS